MFSSDSKEERKRESLNAHTDVCYAAHERTIICAFAVLVKWTTAIVLHSFWFSWVGKQTGRQAGHAKVENCAKHNQWWKIENKCTRQTQRETFDTRLNADTWNEYDHLLTSKKPTATATSTKQMYRKREHHTIEIREQNSFVILVVRTLVSASHQISRIQIEFNWIFFYGVCT